MALTMRIKAAKPTTARIRGSEAHRVKWKDRGAKHPPREARVCRWPSALEFLRRARREVCQHPVGAGALEGDQAFHHRLVAVDPAVLAAAMIIEYSPLT